MWVTVYFTNATHISITFLWYLQSLSLSLSGHNLSICPKRQPCGFPPEGAMNSAVNLAALTYALFIFASLKRGERDEAQQKHPPAPHVSVICAAKQPAALNFPLKQTAVGGGGMQIQCPWKRTIKLLTVPDVLLSSRDVMNLLMFCLTGCVTEHDVSSALAGSGVLQCNKM